MIAEEIQIQSPSQVKREKESKKRSNDRKRSWDPDTYTLGKGIVAEDSEITINEETPREDLIKVIIALKRERDELKDKLSQPLDQEQLVKVCKKHGLKSFADYLKAVDLVNRAEKGKLLSKKN